MKPLQLILGKVNENSSRDVYWQKSSVEHTPLDHKVMNIIIILSYEFIVDNLKFNYGDIEKITQWLNNETNKIFDDFKQAPDEYKGTTIIRQFLTTPFADTSSLLEEIN